MTFPTCKATGLQLEGWGNYQQVAVHFHQDRVEVNQDGSANRYVEDAGVFCSTDCLAAYLERQPGRSEPSPEQLRKRGLPCVILADSRKPKAEQQWPHDVEPF